MQDQELTEDKKDKDDSDDENMTNISSPYISAVAPFDSCSFTGDIFCKSVEPIRAV